MSIRFATILAAAGALGSLPLCGLAQPNERTERASIQLGAFITDHKATARLDSGAGRGTDVDLENDLGLDSTTSVARLGGHFWFRPRGRLDAAVFDLSRTGTLPSAARSSSATSSFSSTRLSRRSPISR
ncbi:MAG TPA: hypothetical protein VFV10_13000 [Gammaproteobacteria bacterium]|nr:hypothetical protein [Gammaproteobacteria bacterium]